MRASSSVHWQRLLHFKLDEANDNASAYRFSYTTAASRVMHKHQRRDVRDKGVALSGKGASTKTCAESFAVMQGCGWHQVRGFGALLASSRRRNTARAWASARRATFSSNACAQPRTPACEGRSVALNMNACARRTQLDAGIQQKACKTASTRRKRE
eukprot:6213061-Pleurochrysis_carterae.AAC.1